MHTLVASPLAAGFAIIGRLAGLQWRNEAESGSLALRLMRSTFGASLYRLLIYTARLST